MADNYEIPIPREAAEAFRTHNGVANLGLIFDRFAPLWKKGGDNAKKQGLEQVANASADRQLLREINTRWEACARAAHAEVFAMKTEWRFVAGLGRKGPLEVGFTFHRYGYPALPGSSVKGIARASALLLHGTKEDDAEFVAIFGRAPKRGEDDSIAQSGGAVFFDAFPSTAPNLELDIMNPHFPKYYQGEAPPTDWQSPVPVFFLTVAGGSEFRFAVGWRGAPNPELQQMAKAWLISGLTELGAGAKTSAGYGYFAKRDEPASVTPPRSTLGASAMPQLLKPAEPPMGELEPGTGTLERKRSREGEQLFVNDDNLKLPVVKERLGTSFNSLPGNGASITYQYDEVNGERRVWRETKKANLKGL